MVETVAVLGDGGWGTALGLLLARKGCAVRVWGAFPEYVAEVARTRINARFLPGVRIPLSVRLTADLAGAVEGASWVVSAVPTQYLRGVCARLRGRLPRGATIVSAGKGIDTETLERCSQILRRHFPRHPVCVLSGPSHAEEVARGLPAAVCAASENGALARRVQHLFGSDRFRVYTCADPVGVELGGAVKNVLAIAAGVADGARLGDNAKAALLTRGLVEMVRLGRALGARPDTFRGLSGLGDLLTTAYSPHGRNLRVGRAVGRGRPVRKVLATMKQVAEGVPTARACVRLARRAGIEMPITREVVRILFHGKDPRRAVSELMRRAPVAE